MINYITDTLISSYIYTPDGGVINNLASDPYVSVVVKYSSVGEVEMLSVQIQDNVIDADTNGNES